ncbi:CLUMA_CG011945, isoform A [Clunio marinus]|uniref:CLUMA_CG011945, isoform A n=1 Tax=Clunio marinus TaxID=568069 RepID=A0A1J1IFF9_9DIPT|nr:CLUMA_CG011945, isoform A [Clunio marinus]
MKVISLLVFAFLFVKISESSRILFVFPSPSKSHLIVVKGLSTTLAERGHDVTVVSPFPLDKPMKNYRDINVEIPQDEMEKFNTYVINNPKPNMFKLMPALFSILFKMSDNMFESEEFKKVLDEEKFDLVIIGMFFNNYLLGIGDHFKCPTMILSVTGTMTMLNVLVGNPLAVTSVQHSFFESGNMGTFSSRVANFLLHGSDYGFIALCDYLFKDRYNQYFPSDRYISYEEAKKNISMILVNTHFSQTYIRPFVPAMVEVGGLQIKPTPDKLPEKLEKWLDEASQHGVIFFSLGSNAKTSFLPTYKIEILLKVFSQLKQRVIMKWESDELEGKPNNVLISKWLPQDDILAHPNVRMFISHCGLGSVVEARYHGVPVVSMPLGIDQIKNAENIVNEGWSVKVDFKNLNEKDLFDAIKEILNDPRYNSKAKTLSVLYRDRPTSAREIASYWVEYVIRHRGAPHIRYPGTDLNFWQYNSIDVILFLLIIAYVLFKIFIVVMKMLMSKIFKQKKKSKTN